MDMLSLSHVSKSFGSNVVIDDLSLTVKPNTIYGFIGQNGAGKTTTMKMIIGILKSDSGVITVSGEKVEYGNNKTNHLIGYLPDVPEFYNYMTPLEYLAFCGKITGMSKIEIKDRSNELLRLVGLESANKRIQGFSRGMKQRLGIAEALLNHPKLLICDEPTSALDPLGRKDILDILSSIKKDTTIIFSTHILSDVERICDEIGLLHKGKLAFTSTMDNIRNINHASGFEIAFAKQKDTVDFMNLLPGGQIANNTKLIYNDKNEEYMAKAMRILLDKNMYPQRIEMLEPTLESVFMEVINK